MQYANRTPSLKEQSHINGGYRKSRGPPIHLILKTHMLTKRSSLLNLQATRKMNY